MWRGRGGIHLQMNEKDLLHLPCVRTLGWFSILKNASTYTHYPYYCECFPDRRQCICVSIYIILWLWYYGLFYPPPLSGQEQLCAFVALSACWKPLLHLSSTPWKCWGLSARLRGESDHGSTFQQQLGRMFLWAGHTAQVHRHWLCTPENTEGSFACVCFNL